MKDHNIENSNEILPYCERIGKRCSNKNAFIDYKLNRTEILIDKEGRPKKEPFHLKLLQ